MERLHPLPRKLWEFPLKFASQPDVALATGAHVSIGRRCTRAVLKAGRHTLELGVA